MDYHHYHHYHPESGLCGYHNLARYVPGLQLACTAVRLQETLLVQWVPLYQATNLAHQQVPPSTLSVTRMWIICKGSSKRINHIPIEASAPQSHHLPAMLASQPYFSSSFAGLSCVAFTVFFVASLYVFPIKKNTASGSGSKSSKSTLPNEDRNGEQSVMDRNHPLVIQQRCKGILLSSVVIPIYLWVVFSVFGVLSPDLVWKWMCMDDTHYCMIKSVVRLC